MVIVFLEYSATFIATLNTDENSNILQLDMKPPYKSFSNISPHKCHTHSIFVNHWMKKDRMTLMLLNGKHLI